MSLATSYSRNSSRSGWKLGARVVGLQRLQTRLGGVILVVGEGLRVDHVQADLAAGARRDLFQELTDSVRVGHDQGRLFLGGVAREIEVQVDRFLELGEHLLGAGTQGKQVVLREIETHAPQAQIGQHHHAQEKHDERQ
jgi:hypothetical protein